MKLNEMTVDELLLQTRASTANPGGGAVLILISNLALNLLLMMDKKDFKDKQSIADVSYETLVNLSQEYTDLSQNDIDNFKDLMDAYQASSITEDHYINAAKPLVSMVENNIEILDILSFYLEFGKLSTITDGEIANHLLKEASIAAIPTIEINLNNTSQNFNKDVYINQTLDLYNKNKAIIERRKQ